MYIDIDIYICIHIYIHIYICRCIYVCVCIYIGLTRVSCRACSTMVEATSLLTPNPFFVLFLLSDPCTETKTKSLALAHAQTILYK